MHWSGLKRNTSILHKDGSRRVIETGISEYINMIFWSEKLLTERHKTRKIPLATLHSAVFLAPGQQASHNFLNFLLCLFSLTHSLLNHILFSLSYHHSIFLPCHSLKPVPSVMLFLLAAKLLLSINPPHFP